MPHCQQAGRSGLHHPNHERGETGMRRCYAVAIIVVLELAGVDSATAQQTREQERHKRIARSFFEEVLDKGRFDIYAESHAKDFVAHGGDHEATLEEDIAAAKEA